MANKADREFFRPMWRRIAVVALLAAWLGYEAMFVGEQLWIMIVGATLAYAVWTFFLNWKDED